MARSRISAPKLRLQHAASEQVLAAQPEAFGLQVWRWIDELARRNPRREPEELIHRCQPGLRVEAGESTVRQAKVREQPLRIGLRSGGEVLDDPG